MKIEARFEVVNELRGAYGVATRAQKGQILDHLCAVTGYQRKYAVAVLRGPARKRRPAKRRRPRRYGRPLVPALRKAWEAAGWICAERLKPGLPQLLAALERHGQIELDEEQRALLHAISVSTLKRLMREIEPHVRRKRNSTTRPGSLLRRDIPIEVGITADRPGLLEIDLVAHCGELAAGEFIYTLCATDIATGWTERLAVLGKSQMAVLEALKRIRSQLPFPLRALHSDNGSEFLNAHVLGWCREADIAYTRGRPYRKNDNAHVEQKNWTLVRRLIGYRRLDTLQQRDDLNALYTELLRVHNNGFQPVMKLIAKHHDGGRTKRLYDQPATPLDRALAIAPTPALSHFQMRLANVDPLRLVRSIERTVGRLILEETAHA
jgi:transposase InsO family protein